MKDEKEKGAKGQSPASLYVLTQGVEYKKDQRFNSLVESLNLSDNRVRT